MTKSAVLIVRPEQLRALDRAARRPFIERTCAQLAEELPAACAALGAERLRAIAEAAVEMAAAHRFRDEADLRHLVRVVIAAGIDLDADGAAVEDILADITVTPAARLARLQREIFRA